MRMQGVLWKRRDVFRNRWRPRWFILQPEQHILTYYLLNDEGTMQLMQPPPQTLSSSSGNRRRTMSESSNVSENTVDYDVVPRGTIYLLGATVEPNDALTRPDEELFVITIADETHATHVHLAARTPEARSQWMAHMRHVASRRRPPSAQRPPRQQRRVHGTAPVPRNLEDSSAYATPPRANGTRSSNSNRVSALSPTTSAQRRTAGGWRMVYSDKLFENVPADLQEQIQKVLRENLPYVEDSPNQQHEWKSKSEEHGIQCSFHKTKPMIRSIRKGIANHRPVEYLQLLWDLNSAQYYETNVREQRLLKKYNAHSSLVYKAYQAVWPTSPRDFATAAFWTLLERRESMEEEPQRTICVIAFSCGAARDEMQDNNNHQPSTPHVRGTLHVAMNFWTMKPDGCYHARIISFELNGNLPKKLSQTVLEQQANMPRVMEAYLTRLKERNGSMQRPDLNMEYDDIYVALEAQKQKSETRNGTVADATITSGIDKHYLSRAQSVVASSKSILHVLKEPLTVEKEAVVLLAPLLLYKLLAFFSVALASLSFVLTTSLAIKWVVGRNLLTILRVLPRSNKEHGAPLIKSVKGCTTCRFTIDLKGVLRFLENEREARSDASSGAERPEILVSHLLVRAVAKAMNELPHLVARQYPFFPPLYAADVVFHDHVTGKGTWVNRADEMTVQEIAEYFTTEHPMPKSFWQNLVGATCHIVTSPDSDHAQVDLDLSLDGVPVCVCVSGIRLEKQNRQPSLSVAITIRSTNIEECREFAETVQKSIQFPETLD
jgi:hypothetical protein